MYFGAQRERKPLNQHQPILLIQVMLFDYLIAIGMKFEEL